MLIGATGTAFPILFTEPKNNTEQWQIKDTLAEGMVFFFIDPGTAISNSEETLNSKLFQQGH